MCVKYTNLSRECPNDSYPLSWIDQLVDNISDYKFLTFMDTCLGYNQIIMTLKN